MTNVRRGVRQLEPKYVHQGLLGTRGDVNDDVADELDCSGVRATLRDLGVT